MEALANFFRTIGTVQEVHTRSRARLEVSDAEVFFG
jgi:hypothetical protein